MDKAIGRFSNFHGGIKDESILDFSISVNPFVPEFILKALTNALTNLRRYTYVEWIEEDFRKHFGEDSIIVAGATEAFQILGWTLMEDSKIIIPTPNYTEYERVANFKSREVSKPNYLVAEKLEIEILKKSIENSCPSKKERTVVITGNPNNPTGVFEDYSEILRWSLEKYGTDVIYVIDEAFIDFVPSNLRRDLNVKAYPNLVIVRSFTKILGLPGVRIGYILSSTFKEHFERYRAPWGIGGDGYTVLKALIENIEEYKKFVRQSQEFFTSERMRFAQFKYIQSLTNYITIRVGNVEKFVKILNDNKMHVRTLHDFGMYECVRLGLRTKEENDKVLECLKFWFKEDS